MELLASMTAPTGADAPVPVGGVITAPAGFAHPSFEAMDGIFLLKSDYPLLGNQLDFAQGDVIESISSGTTNGIYGVAWSGSLFVAVGYSGMILTSPDGITWTARTSGATQYLFSAAWSGSLFVAVGGGGTILTSPDGITWTARTSGTTQSLYGVAWSGSLFVAVGMSGTILTSPDGITWTLRTSGTTQNLYGFTLSGSSERLSIPGNGGTLLSMPIPDVNKAYLAYAPIKNNLRQFMRVA